MYGPYIIVSSSWLNCVTVAFPFVGSIHCGAGSVRGVRFLFRFAFCLWGLCASFRRRLKYLRMACHRYICTYISHVFGFLKSSIKTAKQPTMQPKNKSMQHRIHFSLLLLSYSWGRRGLNEFVLGLNLKWKLLTILNRNNFSRFGIMSSLILVNPSELSPPSSLSWFSCKYKLDLIECSSSSSSFFFVFAKKFNIIFEPKSKANDRKTSSEQLQWVVLLQFGYEFNLWSKHNLQTFKIKSRIYVLVCLLPRTRILVFNLDVNDLDFNSGASI